MLSQILSSTLECECLVDMVVKIILQIRSVNTVCFRGIKSELNSRFVRVGIWKQSLLMLPELHHHRDARSTTSILLLLHEGNIQPHRGAFGGVQTCACQIECRDVAEDPE